MRFTNNLNDNELIRLAQQGNMEAFNLLYERYLPNVFNRVRFTIPETDVEDVTQEVFIAVIHSLRSFRQESQFSTWLQTLTRRKIADYYRRRNPANDPISFDASETDYDEFQLHSRIRSTSSMDDTIMIREALRQLPENYQEVLLLRFAEGFQFNEVAQRLGISLEATKSLFRRAVAALGKRMEDDHD